MFEFLNLIKRFLPPYKKEIFLSVTFNVVAVVFSLFSFAAIIPVLHLLFGIEKTEVVYRSIDFSNGLNGLFDTLKNNLYFYISEMMNSYGSSTLLIVLGLFLIFMTFLKTGASYLASYYIIPIRTGVLRDLRNQIYAKILALPISFFSDERKGDIMARMTGDVGEIENSIMSSLDMVLKNPLMIGIYLGVMFAMSWELTLFVLTLLPLSAWLIGTIGRNLKKTSAYGQEQTGELLSQIEETLGGLRIVKAFSAEAQLNGRFVNLNENIRNTFNKIHRRYNLAHPVSELLGTMVIAILLWFGGTLILSSTNSIGAAEFIYYLVIFYSIIPPAKELSKASYSIRKGLASLDRVDKILKTKNHIEDLPIPMELPKKLEAIHFKNVSFKYEEEWVLKDVDLTIPVGNTVALVGQSGSGKSTLVDLIPRFYEVQKGEICLNNINIKSVRKRELRSLMGNVNQEAILFNDTFYNNIAFGTNNATMEEVVNAAKIANAHQFIMETNEGYQTNIGDRGSKLSGGQRQRISIARAILKNPPVLILDEATSALDTESEKIVQEALENLMKNRTTIVVAHRLSTIKQADMICVMHEGKIVERGKHNDLITLNGYYKKLVDMQSF